MEEIYIVEAVSCMMVNILHIGNIQNNNKMMYVWCGHI